ncbi:hypothetical protein [Gemmatimonas sp.]|uniref:hypothetical protein n=1 Tax=Gemmatimonas sp. TaxID=1962908 RepID=UPI0031F32F3F
MTMPPMPSGSDTPPEVPPEMPKNELPRWAQKQNQQRSLEQPSDGEMEAFIGPKWEKVYRRKMAPFFEDASFVPTWNWSAAIAFPPAWFLYRKLYLPFAFFFLMPGIAFRLLTGTDKPLTMAAMQQPENEWLLMMNAAVFVSTMLASGGTANWFLYRRARAANRLVVQQQLPQADADLLLRRVGGVNKLATSLFVALSMMLAVATIGG